MAVPCFTGPSLSSILDSAQNNHSQAPTRSDDPRKQGEGTDRLRGRRPEFSFLVLPPSKEMISRNSFNLCEPRFLWVMQQSEGFFQGLCHTDDLSKDLLQFSSFPDPALCLLESHLLPYMGSSQHLSHGGATDTDGQQRAFIPPQTCSISGLLSAISHLRLASVI